jgi:type III secretory pathway component EscU
MFHILALITLGAWLTFVGVTIVAHAFGLIEWGKMKIEDGFDFANPQVVHAWFAVITILIILITMVLAHVVWYIWLPMIIVWGFSHISLTDVRVPDPWSKILKWVVNIAEFAYLVFLAFGI